MRIVGTMQGIDRRPLAPVAVGRLELGSPDRGGRTWVSAASGLAAAGGAAWVVSDEYGELVRFDALARPGKLLPGLPPQKRKPDLEALVLAPRADGGSLLVAFGSGSAGDGTRDSALVQRVDAHGQPVGGPRRASLAPLYAALGRQLPHGLNVEALALRDGVAGAELLVVHRGRLPGDRNVVFLLDAARAIAELERGRELRGDLVRSATAVDLGSLDGVPLGASDAKVLPDGRVVLSASAEAPGDGAVGDGRILGSAIAILGPDLRVQAVRMLTGPARKVEGVELASALDAAAGASELVLVTDPDDPKAASEVLRVDLGA